MQLGIFAKTFSGIGVDVVLNAAKASGYETVQFNMACVGSPSMPDDISSTQTLSIAEASRATGISIAAVSATYNLIHPDQKVRDDGMRRLGVMIRAARDMGTGLVTLCTGTRDPDDQWRHHPDNQNPQAWRDLLVEMGKAAVLAESFDVDLGVEPELANVVNSAISARRLIDEIGSSRIRIVLDPANLFDVVSEEERRAGVAAAVDLLGDRISMAHAKDRDGRGNFVAAGTGVIDFPHFVSCMRGIDFRGPLVTHGLSEAEAPKVAAFLKGVLAQ